jgi:hypothetical protein
MRHPLWQKKRLEVLDRSNFQCDNCGESERTLHVHHNFYERGRKPWEYPTESLVALCETCHTGVGLDMDLLNRAIGMLPYDARGTILGFVAAVGCFEYSNHEIDIGGLDYERADGIGKYLGLSADEVIEAKCEREDGTIDFCVLDEAAAQKRERLTGSRR